MAKEFSRTRRVGEQIQRELAALIRTELKDPRLGSVTVLAVDVSRDLSHAKVFFSVLGGDEAANARALPILRHAAGFLRRELGRGLHTRTTPELHFVPDTSIERGAHLSALIDEAVAKDREHTKD